MPFLAGVLPTLTERMFAGQVDKLARMLGWARWYDAATNAPRRCPKCSAEINLPRNPPGWPDRVYLRGDVLWFVEFKTDRGRLSDAQNATLAALRAVKRVRVAVWRPRMIQAITEALR